MTETDVALRYPGGELPLPVVQAAEGSDGLDTSKLLSTTGKVALDIGFVNTASCTSAITYIDGDAGILRYRGYPDRPAGRALQLPRGHLPADLRRAADRRPAGRVRPAHPPAHPAARGPQAVLQGLPARRAPDAGALLGGQRPVDLLPGLAGPVRRGAGGDLHAAPAGEAADHRGLRLQEVGRPAVPLPGQLLRAGRELPADDVRLPGRALRAGPRPGQGAGHAVHPARRPRAELLDVDGPAGRLLARQPLRLGLGRHQRAVRPAARRRQPVGARDARGASRPTAATSRASSSG